MRLPGFLLGRWTRTSGGLTSADFVPHPFALHAITGAEEENGPVLAWGMTLPDGSVVTVDWRDGPSSGVTLSANADSAARLHDAELVWMPAPA